MAAAGLTIGLETGFFGVIVFCVVVAIRELVVADETDCEEVVESTVVVAPTVGTVGAEYDWDFVRKINTPIEIIIMEKGSKTLMCGL